jgi:hypothetical protein
VANVSNRSRTVTIEVCLSFNFDAVFDFKLFSGSTPIKLNLYAMRKKNLKIIDAANWTALPNYARGMVASIYWRRVTFFFISLSPFP